MAKITLNGTELFTGNSTMIGVIYNNLTGKNLSGNEYKQYIAQIENMIKTPVSGRVCLKNSPGTILKEKEL